MGRQAGGVQEDPHLPALAPHRAQLAGRAMLIPNGLPRSLAPQPPVPLPGR